MRQISTLVFAAAVGVLSLHPQAVKSQTLVAAVDTGKASKPAAESGLMYTTYFYTATEALVHGYEKDTSVRIVSLKENRTVWKGKVGPGDIVTIPTGQGVFGFLSDKKAAILVGTPTSCPAVGYYLRDENGVQVADHFYTQLPASFSSDNRVIVWAWKDTSFVIRDRTTKKTLHEGRLANGDYYEITYDIVSQLNGHTLEFKASGDAIAVQVYYDQGFFVAADNGTTTGRKFHTFVGTTTSGPNDLNIMAYEKSANAVVRDLKTKKVIWEGNVAAGQTKSMSLAGKYVEVSSAGTDISVSVAPSLYQGNYAEHHFGGGRDGSGIDKEFLLTSPQELWIFSYYSGNEITVEDAKTGKKVWSGKLNAGQVEGLNPGQGHYRVHAKLGVSTMGGSSACGAEYSPAAGLFRVDEALFKVSTALLEARKQEAARDGKTLTPAQLAAPPAAAEIEQVKRSVYKSTGKSMSDDEVRQRWDAVYQNQSK